MVRLKNKLLLTNREFTALVQKHQAQALKDLFLRFNAEGYADRDVAVYEPDLIDSERPISGHKVS